MSAMQVPDEVIEASYQDAIAHLQARGVHLLDTEDDVLASGIKSAARSIVVWALSEAREAALRQIQLASIVGHRPSDFEKGVMSCAVAIDALRVEVEEGLRDE